MALPRRGVLAALLAAGLLAPAFAQTPPSRIRGTLLSRDGDTLTVAAKGGETVKAVVTEKTSVILVVPATLDDIRPGSFVGAAAVPGPNGALMALEVHIFPEAMRGAGEGHRAFDLQPESTMTNGTVGDVAAASGRTLTVGYKGGQQTIVVPPETPIVGFSPGTPALLTPGAHVIVFGGRNPDSTYTATGVLVGKDGLVPPM